MHTIFKNYNFHRDSYRNRADVFTLRFNRISIQRSNNINKRNWEIMRMINSKLTIDSIILQLEKGSAEDNRLSISIQSINDIEAYEVVKVNTVTEAVRVYLR